jgi:hypothetical protein
MKIIDNHPRVMPAVQAKSHRDGCEKVTDGESLKMKLRIGKGLSEPEFSRRSLQMIQDEKEPLQNRVFAVQGLARIRPAAEIEDTLLRVVTKKDPVLGFSALKALGRTGTAKTFEALSAVGALPLKSMERQKDFAMVLIGYRQQIAGAEKIMERLLKDAGEAPRRREELPLRFQAMKPEEATSVLQQVGDADGEVALSRRTAFEVEAAGHTFYFYFSTKLEDPAAWEDVVKNKQIIGQLFRKDKHAKAIAQQYVGLSTPAKDGAQISFFRKDGELFMLANMVYDKAKKTFVVANVKEEPAKKVTRAELQVDRSSTISMSLSFLRRSKKKSAGEAPAGPPQVRDRET